MVSFKKVLVLFLISKFVGYIISSSSSSLLVNAMDPDSPKPTASPRKIPKKQCHGSCDCARYSHYDVPSSLKGFGESEKRPPIPAKRTSLPKLPERPPINSDRKGIEKGLVKNPIYDTIKPKNDKLTFETHPINGSFYKSYGRPVEEDIYNVNGDDEPIYEEIGTDYFTKEHTPSGYTEHIYDEPCELPVPQKTKYQKFKERAGEKLASLKKCSKNGFRCKSKKPKDSDQKTKKGVSDATSNLNKKSPGSKKVSTESPSVTRDKLNKASKDLLREADILASKLNEGKRPKHHGFNKYISRSVKGSKDKTKRELKETGLGFSDIGKDLRSDASHLEKGAKAKLQGAKDKVKGGLDKFKNNLKKSAFKGSYSVAGHMADQMGDLGNFKTKSTM
ncbi:hypothetical protein MACK_000306 [Theileria orientalis]|uniref:Signal peptide containing protein n=1 Tax=Theileria orientalis TaxID=68886 RepID=A0A976M9P6_THEOR|nr:hypothetical protein MACK_000306 [Theileria orientalis]